MGGTELPRRLRNQKRRASRKARADARTSNEHGGTVVKVWTNDAWDTREMYTDEEWRAECEQRRMNLRAKAEEVVQQNRDIKFKFVEVLDWKPTDPSEKMRITSDGRTFTNINGTYYEAVIDEDTDVKANLKQVGGDHYKNMGVEPWDVVDTWPIEQRIGAYRHGALKYLMRMGSKDENAQEVGKGIHYMEKLLEVVKEAYND